MMKTRKKKVNRHKGGKNLNELKMNSKRSRITLIMILMMALLETLTEKQRTLEKRMKQRKQKESLGKLKRRNKCLKIQDNKTKRKIKMLKK